MFYEWYELESALAEVDHTLPVAATVQRMGPEATVAAVKAAPRQYAQECRINLAGKTLKADIIAAIRAAV